MGHVSPFLLTSLRWFVALILIAPFAINQLRSDWLAIKSRIVFLFVLGAIGFTFFNNIMYLALINTSAINVAIIQSSLPLFVFVLNIVFFAVGVTRFQVIGFPITLIGVVVIAFQGDFSLLAELKVNIGDGLMIIAIAAYGIYSVFLKNKPNIHWLSTMAVLAAAAFVASLPFVLFEGISGNLNTPDLTGLSIVLYTAVFASLGSQLCWMRSIELIGSNATSMFINLVPFFGSVLAVVLLGETFYAFHAVGLSLIIIGIYIAQLTVRSALK